MDDGVPSRLAARHYEHSFFNCSPIHTPTRANLSRHHVAFVKCFAADAASKIAPIDAASNCF